jgi:hypothetical protein
MHKMKYKQMNNSSKKSNRHQIKRNHTKTSCKKGETDESIRIRKLSEFVKRNNQMYDAINKKYQELQSKKNNTKKNNMKKNNMKKN